MRLNGRCRSPNDIVRQLHWLAGVRQFLAVIPRTVRCWAALYRTMPVADAIGCNGARRHRFGVPSSVDDVFWEELNWIGRFLEHPASACQQESAQARSVPRYVPVEI